MALYTRIIEVNKSVLYDPAGKIKVGQEHCQRLQEKPQEELHKCIKCVFNPCI